MTHKPSMRIERMRLTDKPGECARCSETGLNLRDIVQRLNDDPDFAGVHVELQEIPTLPTEIPLSNTIVINGRTVEDLLSAEVRMTHCASCSCTLESQTDCRALEINGELYETLTPELILTAARKALETV